MLLHLLFSTFLWMPANYPKLWDKTDVAVVPILNGTKLDQFGMMKGEGAQWGMHKTVWEQRGLQHRRMGVLVGCS